MEKLGDILGEGPPSQRQKNTKSRPESSPPGETDLTLEEELRALAIRASTVPPETRETHRLNLLKPRPDVKGFRQAVEGARALLDQRLAWLTLTGPVGTGKSHIAIGTAWDWLEAGRHCRYTTVSGMLERLKRTYDLTPEQAGENREPRFEKVFGWYCETPLLILEDLGVEKLTDWALEKLDTLVDYRYLRRLPLLVTTNIAIAQLPVRLADRFMDKRLGRVIALSGPSYRSVDTPRH